MRQLLQFMPPPRDGGETLGWGPIFSESPFLPGQYLEKIYTQIPNWIFFKEQSPSPRTNKHFLQVGFLTEKPFNLINLYPLPFKHF